ARDVVGLLGDLLDELGADLLVRIVEFDLLGDGDAVVGDGGGAPGLLEHDVASLGAEGHLDGIGELVHTLLEAAPGFLVVRDELGHFGISPVWCVSTRPTCPRRTKPHAAFMSRGAGSLTGPECMWSGSGEPLPDQAPAPRAAPPGGVVTLDRRVPDHHKHSGPESANSSRSEGGRSALALLAAFVAAFVAGLGDRDEGDAGLVLVALAHLIDADLLGEPPGAVRVVLVAIEHDGLLLDVVGGGDAHVLPSLTLEVVAPGSGHAVD